MNKTLRGAVKSASLCLAEAKSFVRPVKSAYSTDVITLLDTAMNSENAGDAIIMSYAEDRLREVFPTQRFIHLQTHGQAPELEHARRDTLKILCGSNILWQDMREPLAWPLLHLDAYRHSVCLMAVGVAVNDGEPFEFSRESQRLLKYILDPSVMHSVRDENAKRQLEAIGITNVINTGCVTMWRLTPEFCRSIPTGKHRDVLTTVTDYKVDPELDRCMLENLLDSYENVYLWVQSEKDRTYVSQLMDASRIRFVDHGKGALDSFLDTHATEIDYFGTRLHAGVHCLNHGVRSMVVAIDNRARDIARDTNLPTVERVDLPQAMKSLIEGERETEIRIPLQAIDRWKSQFSSFSSD